MSGCLLGAVCLVIVPGRGADPPAATVAARMIDAGSWYSRERWPHDGAPHESQNLVVFSDAADQEARRQVAALGEEILAELIAEFGIDARMLRLPPDQRKIHLYIYQNRFPRAWGARAYHAGVIIWSPDHAHRDTDRDNYRSTLKHELVHVVTNAMVGKDPVDMTVDTMVHVWFSEGFAEATRGETTRLTIGDIGHLNHLIARYGRFNPVSFVHDGQVMAWSQDKPALVGYRYHYPMYRLAVEYLMDPKGFGIPRSDLLRIYTDMADGSGFATAFEHCTGIAVADYEQQFFDRMDDYLDGDVTAPFRLASLVWLVLVAGSLAVLVRAITRGPETRRKRIATWVPVTVLFGPLGLLGYRYSRRNPEGCHSKRRQALAASMSGVTWAVAGLLLVYAMFANLAPYEDVGADLQPLDVVIPFLFAWLVFRGLILLVRRRRGARISIRRSLPAELLATVLAVAGVLAVLTPLDDYWWFSLDPRTLLFWSFLSAGAIAGAGVVYPYRVWYSYIGLVSE